MVTTYATITTYTVKSGDNLGSIAIKLGMTLAEIQSLNNISDPNKIQIGQVLKVYSNTSGGGTTPKTTTYTVKLGDNLGSIAIKFGMTLAEIQSLNNITDPNIFSFVGSEIAFKYDCLFNGCFKNDVTISFCNNSIFSHPLHKFIVRFFS